MSDALGLSLPINFTHRDFLFPIIDSELGMIVLSYGVIIDKIAKEDFRILSPLKKRSINGEVRLKSKGLVQLFFSLALWPRESRPMDEKQQNV